MEGLLPLIADVDFVDSLNLEFGYRSSDFSSFGTTDSWKLGLNWSPVDSLLLRVMSQKANRAPNVGELSSPVTRGLGDATIDPCSVANPNISAELAALCVSTGMNPALVGQVPDIISGQINTFAGSDPFSPPNPEEADTFTAGFVYSPTVDFAESLSISVDYYDIDITDVIGTFAPQEVLDGCYVLGDANECAKIRRQGGDLTGDLAGVDTYFTNLDYLQAEGIEIGYSAIFSLGDNGSISLQGNINKYLTQESQSSSTTPVLDCKGYYGTSCDPISDLRWNQRISWDYENLSVSLFWRHIAAIDILPNERDSVFEQFRSIDAYNYIDIFASYAVTDYMTVSAGIDNLTDEAPPVVGGEVGDTSSNGGNTFPSNYDVLGTMYKVGVRFRF
jgi:outer membrane receptor protein involved in Fe transport